MQWGIVGNSCGIAATLIELYQNGKHQLLLVIGRNKLVSSLSTSTRPELHHIPKKKFIIIFLYISNSFHWKEKRNTTLVHKMHIKIVPLKAKRKTKRHRFKKVWRIRNIIHPGPIKEWFDQNLSLSLSLSLFLSLSIWSTLFITRLSSKQLDLNDYPLDLATNLTTLSPF
jgi:hypothetical protein